MQLPFDIYTKSHTLNKKPVINEEILMKFLAFVLISR